MGGAMNRDDIIRIARDAGFTWEPINNIIGPLERFSALVASHEREACAKIADEIDDMTGREIADSIRARGEV